MYKFVVKQARFYMKTANLRIGNILKIRRYNFCFPGDSFLDLNPFHSTGPLLYLMKTSENPCEMD